MFALSCAPGVVHTAAALDPVDWSSIDGGGHFNATGGAYRLAGTIGQPDAGVLAGGNDTLRGGYWLGPATPTVDAPPTGPVPIAFGLRAPAPNPARSRAILSFDLPAATDVRIRVHDVSGRAVRSVDLGRLAAGRHDEAWATVDDTGRPLPSGMYFLRLEAGRFEARRRVLVLQ